MCDFSENLVAWLDGEVPPEEAERTRLHLESCLECRLRVDAYRRATLELVEFCNEQLALESPRVSYGWAAKISAAAAVAAVVALVIVTFGARFRRRPVALREPVSPAAAVSTGESLPLPAHGVERARRRQQVGAAPHRIQDASIRPDRHEKAYSPPYEPVIEISIPAEEMFPPGAVPPGMGFAGDVSISADGLPDRLRLRPRLVGFERRTTIP
jgi:hypothetical protein